jgi:hypothetical protein
LRELSLLPVLADMLQVPFGIAVRGQLPDCRGIGLIRSSARIGAGNRLSPPRHRFPSCPQPESPHIVSDILSPELPAQSDPARARITAAWSRDETEAVNDLLGQASLGPVEREQVLTRAADLVGKVRAKSDDQGAVESFMRQYDLGSEEGVLLMCVAEALLRVPDRKPPTS